MVLAQIEKKEIELPEGVSAQLDGYKLTIQGPKGAITREFRKAKYTLAVEGKMAVVSCDYPRRKDKALVGTVAGHIGNMIKGVTNGFHYKMQINYSHFPMNVSVSGNKVMIKNFLGEKYPRESQILQGVKVEVKGQEISVTGADKENVGQTAANLVLATKIGRKDPRVFGDGIFITSKGDKQ